MTRRRWFCFCRGSALLFFWLRRIGMMADHRHHGEGEHHHRYVAMPAVPGSALVVIEPELVFGGLETVLDRPAMAFDRDRRFQSDGRRVDAMSAAVPETDRRLPQDRNT